MKRGNKMLMIEITNDPFALQAKAKTASLKRKKKDIAVQQTQLMVDKARDRANKANQKLTKLRSELRP